MSLVQPMEMVAGVLRPAFVQEGPNHAVVGIGNPTHHREPPLLLRAGRCRQIDLIACPFGGSRPFEALIEKPLQVIGRQLGPTFVQDCSDDTVLRCVIGIDHRQ